MDNPQMMKSGGGGGTTHRLLALLISRRGQWPPAVLARCPHLPLLSPLGHAVSLYPSAVPGGWNLQLPSSMLHRLVWPSHTVPARWRGWCGLVSAPPAEPAPLTYPLQVAGLRQEDKTQQCNHSYTQLSGSGSGINALLKKHTKDDRTFAWAKGCTHSTHYGSCQEVMATNCCLLLEHKHAVFISHP